MNSKTFNMEQYINKSALIAEIEKRIKELQDLSKENEKKLDSFQKTAILLCIDECKVVLDILDSLEVKEVDLEKEAENFVKTEEFVKNGNPVLAIAKYFFELGLKIQKGE